MRIAALDIGYSTGLVVLEYKDTWAITKHMTIEVVNSGVDLDALQYLVDIVKFYTPKVVIEFPFWDCANSHTPYLNWIKGWLMTELFDVEYVEVYPSDWKQSFAPGKIASQIDMEQFNSQHEKDAVTVAYWAWRTHKI